MAKRKHYDREFRIQACKLVVEQGYSYNEVSERLGVSSWSVRQWVKKYRSEGVFPPAGQTNTAAEELKQLRKENKRLQIENEILKKATAYFAKDHV